MTYNDWRDELKNNLLCVSEAERRRVLDYYAEAYADRRDAGFTEREIIDDFGAPYDAAQRILTECDAGEPAPKRRNIYGETVYSEPEERGARRGRRAEQYEQPAPPPQPQQTYTQNAAAYAPQPAPKQRGDYTWVFVLLCIVFAVPIFFVILGMVIITASLGLAPIAIMCSGVAVIGSGVGAMFGDLMSGAVTVAMGLIVFGLSLIIMPLCFKLIKLMWKLFKMFFGWLKRMFSGKEKV